LSGRSGRLKSGTCPRLDPTKPGSGRPSGGRRFGVFHDRGQASDGFGGVLPSQCGHGWANWATCPFKDRPGVEPTFFITLGQSERLTALDVGLAARVVFGQGWIGDADRGDGGVPVNSLPLTPEFISSNEESSNFGSFEKKLSPDCHQHQARKKHTTD
jgi:hypothetical protein